MRSRIAALILVVVTTVATPSGVVSAASLAGNTGDVRHKPFFPFDATGGCKDAWKKYVASSGHAAYATTPYSNTAEAVMCGASFNAGSQAAAEGRALASCENALKRYKLTAVRKCEIAASK